MAFGKRGGAGRYSVEQTTHTKGGIEKALNEQAAVGKTFVFAIPGPGPVVQLVFEENEN